ncbi:hypothetical protein BD410DRAFT_796056, partial [Rickenella mellea]
MLQEVASGEEIARLQRATSTHPTSGWEGVETDAFQRKTIYRQAQTRSADEPMTMNL